MGLKGNIAKVYDKHCRMMDEHSKYERRIQYITKAIYLEFLNSDYYNRNRLFDNTEMEVNLVDLPELFTDLMIGSVDIIVKLPAFVVVSLNFKSEVFKLSYTELKRRIASVATKCLNIYDYKDINKESLTYIDNIGVDRVDDNMHTDINFDIWRFLGCPVIKTTDSFCITSDTQIFTLPYGWWSSSIKSGDIDTGLFDGKYLMLVIDVSKDNHDEICEDLDKVLFSNTEPKYILYFKFESSIDKGYQIFRYYIDLLHQKLSGIGIKVYVWIDMRDVESFNGIQFTVGQYTIVKHMRELREHGISFLNWKDLL